MGPTCATLLAERSSTRAHAPLLRWLVIEAALDISPCWRLNGMGNDIAQAEDASACQQLRRYDEAYRVTGQGRPGRRKLLKMKEVE